MVWSDDTNVSLSGIDIYGRNLASGAEFVVCEAPDNQYDPDVDGDIAVWVDWRSHLAGNGEDSGAG